MTDDMMVEIADMMVEIEDMMHELTNDTTVEMTDEMT